MLERNMEIDRQWEREWFQAAINDVKACKFKRFSDNFV